MINKDPVFDKMQNFLEVLQVPHVNDLAPTKQKKKFLFKVLFFNPTFQG